MRWTSLSASVNSKSRLLWVDCSSQLFWHWRALSDLYTGGGYSQGYSPASEYLLLCVTDKGKSCWFAMTWEWVNYARTVFGCTVSLNLSLLRLSKDQLFENCSVIPKEESIIYRFHMLSLQLGRWCCPRRIYSWSSCRYPAVGARHLRLTVTSQEAAGHLLYAAFTWESLRLEAACGKSETHTHTHTRDEKVWLGTCSSFWLLKSDRCQTLLIQTFTLARHATAASVMRARFSPRGVDATLLTKWCQILKYPR